MAELLFELLSEEIPARMQAQAAADLKRLVVAGLDQAGLVHETADAFVTPRRLALVVDGLPDRQPDTVDERKGPRVGAPAKAVEGFLRSAGLASVDEADVRETDKGSFYFAVRTRSGQPTADALVAVLTDAVARLPWPKSMRWADFGLRWVRPLHNILAILDGAVIGLSIDPMQSAGDDGEPRGARLEGTDRTRGHRFMAPEWFPVLSAADYRAKLHAAKVILDPVHRRTAILGQATVLAEIEGLSLKDDPGLLDEVTGLVEWPVVRIGRIDAAFMDVPPEVLTTAMRAHQKYFSLMDADGRLAPHFAVVANLEATDGGAAIVAGNERVLRARLSDAKFFWDQDRKQRLEDRVPKLQQRVFHARLGSDYQRTHRLTTLATEVARDAGFVAADIDEAGTAARLCKADLTTGMVGEFPELQGVMGRYYALNDGAPAAVADAIAAHYAPQGPSDRCPTAPVSVAVSLADKLDTLVGFFGIDERPTGSRDPYALRRAALGVIRLIVENRLRLDLKRVLHRVIDGYRCDEGSTAESKAHFASLEADALASDVIAFVADRLKVHLRGEGVRHDLIAAVFALGGEHDLVRLLARVDALKRFLDTEDGANVLAAYRRATNIVRIEENKDSARYDGEVEAALLSQGEETGLQQKLNEARARMRVALDDERYADAMSILAGLRSPVDAFFDNVTVNCPEPAVRANRLRLLSQMRSALGGVADFSQIEG
jgi:glycyl-tRNA synthetase beta chain